MQDTKAGYVGSTMELGGSLLKSFDRVNLDDWKKIGHNINPNIVKYKAQKDNSKVILKMFNIKKPEILNFRKDAKITISSKILKFRHKDILKKNTVQGGV